MPADSGPRARGKGGADLLGGGGGADKRVSQVYNGGSSPPPAPQLSYLLSCHRLSIPGSG